MLLNKWIVVWSVSPWCYYFLVLYIWVHEGFSPRVILCGHRISSLRKCDCMLLKNLCCDCWYLNTSFIQNGAQLPVLEKNLLLITVEMLTEVRSHFELKVDVIFSFKVSVIVYFMYVFLNRRSDCASEIKYLHYNEVMSIHWS